MPESEIEALLRCICFKTGPPRAVGVEVEWLVQDVDDPLLPVPHPRLAEAHEALRGLPLSSALTVEPGGQLELSSLPAPDLMACVKDTAADLDLVRDALDGHGLVLAGHGQDPWLPPRRFLHTPRYEAMERAMDRHGPAGRAMMCSSASVQVCLDAGYEEPGPLGLGRRWALAHLLGAVLVAAFANSPMRFGRPTGWRSTRQSLWNALDPARVLAPAGGDPREAWAAYVMDTPVMCIRGDSAPWAVPEHLTFREWVRTGQPTQADLDYHMSTLFPPVRPRGHLELRMIDAQPGPDGWIVPLAVVAALFDDPVAAESAYRAVKPLADTAGDEPAPRNPLWRSAARNGLSDPELHTAALLCFEAALKALPRIGATAGVQAAVTSFIDRYVSQARCPADDLLEAQGHA